MLQTSSRKSRLAVLRPTGHLTSRQTGVELRGHEIRAERTAAFPCSLSDECLATLWSVSLDETAGRFRHLGGLRRALGINGKHLLACPGGGLMTARDRARPDAGRRAAPNGAAPGWFGSVREPQPVDRRDHRRGAFVDGVHDLGVVDAAQVHGRDPEVGMPELPLDDHERHALARHLDRVSMP